MTFNEYIAQSRRMTLPDAHTMLATGRRVTSAFPDEEETERLLNREKKRPLAPRTGGTRKAKHSGSRWGRQVPAG